MAVRIENQAEPIPGYKLIERIGGGGFGEVWKAEAPGGLHKAIKFVFGDLEVAGEDGQRAEQELKALSRVKTVRHPYILSLERYDIIDGQLMIVMELADRNLWDRFKECRTQGLPGIPRDELLGYMEETAEALDLMNNQYQLQHLDIKPQNLFLVHNHIKVADFGLVKDLEGMQASVTGGVTPVYAAPETFDGWVSRYSDQYSLAIVYQEVLTGQRPFSGTNIRHLILQHLQTRPNVSPLPPGEQAIIARALAKVPDDRFPTCREMVHGLRNASGTAAAPATPTPSGTSSATLPASTPRGPSSSLEATPLVLPIFDRDERAPSQTQIDKTASIRARPAEPLLVPSENHRITPSSDVGVLRPAGGEARKVVPEVAGEGTLFPALVIGLGQLGMTVVQRLAEQVHTQLAPREQLPNLRLMVLDTDPELARAATRGRPGIALSGSEVFLAPLNRPSHYLKPREGRAKIDTWLNPRMLYRIPRSQVTTGVRALGRLAFCENYRGIVRRLQAELDACLDPGALPMAARQTGLGVRSNRPRVYIISSLAGGTGSGIFLDLAYTARALLRQMGFEQPDVVGLLLLPPVDRNRTRALTLGNAYAALTELKHFSSPGTTFTARYHEREAPVEDSAPPFRRCVLLPLPEETDEVATRELVELAGQFLLRDIFSPLGRAADLGRAGVPSPSWEERGLYGQTFGLYRLHWPRHAFLDAVARGLCQRLVKHWLSKDSKPVRVGVQVWVQEQWARLELGADRFMTRLREGCDHALGRPAESAFAAILDPFVQRYAPGQPVAPSAAARGAAGPTAREVANVLAALEQLVGNPREEGPSVPPSEVAQVLREGAERLASEWGQKLAELPVRLIEEPEYRLAGAEEAVRQLIASVEQILHHHEPLARDLTSRAAQAHARLQAFAQGAGKRSALPTEELLGLLRSFPKWRYQSLILQQTAAAFVGLRGHLSDELREINFCRVRLGELLRQFEQPSGATAEAALGRPLFPAGCKDLREAVHGFLDMIEPPALLELDARIEAMIRKQFTALVNICLTSANVIRNVEEGMVQTASDYAADRLEEVDVAGLFFEHHSEGEETAGEVSSCFQEAAPELGKTRAGNLPEVCVLTTPPSPAGERFRQLAGQVLPELEILAAASGDEILIYRERANVPLAELEQLGPIAEDAYRRMTAADNFTPHCRIDVNFSPKPQ